jgi:hypothetical protein
MSMLDDRIAELEDENAALQRENAALRADKERLDWLFTHDGGMWLYWAIDRDWTPERSASRAAIDAARKEAQP